MGGGAAAGFGDSSLDSESLGNSVQAATQAGDVGELFKYEIDGPVTLARQSSAMLPIINGAIEGDKVSIYNAGVHENIECLFGIHARCVCFRSPRFKRDFTESSNSHGFFIFRRAK